MKGNTLHNAIGHVTNKVAVGPLTYLKSLLVLREHPELFRP